MCSGAGPASRLRFTEPLLMSISLIVPLPLLLT